MAGRADAKLGARLDALAPQERLLVTVGVRFSLHGDTIPDERRPPALPDLDEAGRPLFSIRGNLPFHDSPTPRRPAPSC